MPDIIAGMRGMERGVFGAMEYNSFIHLAEVFIEHLLCGKTGLDPLHSDNDSPDSLRLKITFFKNIDLSVI